MISRRPTTVHHAGSAYTSIEKDAARSSLSRILSTNVEQTRVRDNHSAYKNAPAARKCWRRAGLTYAPETCRKTGMSDAAAPSPPHPVLPANRPYSRGPILDSRQQERKSHRKDRTEGANDALAYYARRVVCRKTKTNLTKQTNKNQSTTTQNPTYTVPVPQDWPPFSCARSKRLGSC